MNTANAIMATFQSPNVSDSNLEDANVVDAIAILAGGARSVANAITPAGTAANRDAAGGTVGSLTESVMGLTAGMVAIANAIEELAEAVRAHEPCESSS